MDTFSLDAGKVEGRLWSSVVGVDVDLLWAVDDSWSGIIEDAVAVGVSADALAVGNRELRAAFACEGASGTLWMRS